jgi:hypothetical protein|tara:strand:+ start:2105 stop:2299 length:195 start_codon:yes stop_codon:yes gene_type:complete
MLAHRTSKKNNKKNGGIGMKLDLWLELYSYHSKDENRNMKGFSTSEYNKQQELKMKDSKYGVYK